MMCLRFPQILFPSFVLLFGIAQPAVAQIPIQGMSQRGPDAHFSSMGHELSSLSGNVVSGAGENPVGNAKVDLTEGPSGKPVSSTYTDNTGSFSFSGIPSGTYHITATAGVAQVS